MDWLFRLLVLAVLSALMIGTLRNTVPALTLLLSIAALIAILLPVFSAAEEIKGLYEQLMQLSGLTSEYITPVIKCMAIAMLSRLGADVCRDGGVNVLAGGIEIAGTVAAVIVTLPLMEAVLDTVMQCL